MRAEIERAFGRRLRELRERRRLTHAQLSEACGLSTNYLGALERGAQNPTLRVLDKLATGLGIELSDLVQLRHQASTKVLRSEMTAKIRNASDEDLRRIVQLMKVLLP